MSSWLLCICYVIKNSKKDKVCNEALEFFAVDVFLLHKHYNIVK